VSSFETENYFDEMVEAYNEAVKANIPPLILIPTLIHDFLCIHPFDDGNGRMSRILTLLLLYKSGYFVGRYISIEMLIEESKDSYYEELQNSSEKWHTGENDELPFIKYMLGIFLKAYKEYGGYPSLFLQYTVFGQVYEGMDVVDKIAAVETNETNDKPKTDVVIENIVVKEAE